MTPLSAAEKHQSKRRNSDKYPNIIRQPTPSRINPNRSCLEQQGSGSEENDYEKQG